MTGSAEAFSVPRRRWSNPLASCRYFPVDGGTGAELLAALAGLDPRLEPVASPRHADLLLVVEPISQKLAPSATEVARALPRPARALVVADPVGQDPFEDVTVSMAELLPGARRARSTSLEGVAAAMLGHGGYREFELPAEDGWKPDLVPLDVEKELATELAVLSLGPIQPFTAGPLRTVLICDGGQILSARVESGYAHRGVARAMAGSGWSRAGELAAALDPLAPLTGLLAFRRAIEALQGRETQPEVQASRELALALERSRSRLWWLVRFLRPLEAGEAVGRALEAARHLDRVVGASQDTTRTEAASPEPTPLSVRKRSTAAAAELADRVRDLRKALASDRLLALRTRGIGFISEDSLRQAGVSGPVLEASERGAGDVEARMLVRLDAALADLARASEIRAEGTRRSSAPGQLPVPSGTVEGMAEGPRGELRLRVVSEGGEGPAQVDFASPSRALLSLLPDLLAGQKVADAGLLLASLDLSMAEADG